MQEGPQWFFRFCFHNMYRNPHFIESRWQMPPWMCKGRRRAGMLLICLPSGQRGTGGGWDMQCSADECRKQGWNIESGWLGGRNTNRGHQGTIREGREKEKGGKSQWKRCTQDSPGLSFLCPESYRVRFSGKCAHQAVAPAQEIVTKPQPQRPGPDLILICLPVM